MNSTDPSTRGAKPVALITGAARGIGAATARRLHADGWEVVLVDQCADEPALAYPLATPDDLRTVGADCGDASTHEIDVRDLAALREAVRVAANTHGRLDAAVAAAGVIAGGAPAWELPETVWSTVIDVDLGGVHNLAVAAIPAMLPNPDGTGRFVAVSSTAAVRGMPGLAAYSAAKAGVEGLIRGLSADLADSGITANAVAPGSTATPILEASATLYDLDGPDGFAAHQVIGRLLDPEEIAATIAWLCSPASSAITGSVIPADGGMRL